MKDLARRYPDDNDAAVLYAESLMDLKPWQLWTADGRPQEGTDEILKTLESVLARDPDHPGANHYYIHSIEASPNPQKALASAERLKTLVPGAGHLVHMPAHIYMRTGDYPSAIEANQAGVRADETYIARTHAQGIYPMMYYTHNFQFLSSAAGMAGRCKDALEAAAKAVSVAAPMVEHEPMAEYVLPSSLFAMARCEKWDDILSYSRPADSTLSVLAFWNYARGLAHIAKGDFTHAAADRQELGATQAKIPATLQLNLNRAQDLVAIAAFVLDARLAEARGNRAAALTAWQKAVDFQDRLVYDEPPAWYYPVRESMGGAYLRARR
jgi:tetratricopeptide (TPR) repeat protein